MQKIENENYFGKQLKGTEYEYLSLFSARPSQFSIFAFFSLFRCRTNAFLSSHLCTQLNTMICKSLQFFLLKRASMNL